MEHSELIDFFEFFLFIKKIVLFLWNLTIIIKLFKGVMAQPPTGFQPSKFIIFLYINACLGVVLNVCYMRES